MTNSPPSYRQDLVRVAELTRQARGAFSGEPDRTKYLPEVKELALELHPFLLRWRGQPQFDSDRVMREHLEALEANVEHWLELAYLSALDKVLVARADQIRAECFVQAAVSLAALHRDVPAALKAELEAVCREHTGKDFDPEAEFRESTAEADQTEATYQARLREIQADWPERAEDTVLQRLKSAATPDIIAQLTEEMSQRLVAIRPKPHR